MCYMTILSTTAEDNLSIYNNKLVQFSIELPNIPEEKYLAFENKWFIGSQSGCSCDFRHLCSYDADFNFGKPVDWYEEDEEDIEATRQVIAIIRKLIEKGASVDCVDVWAHGQQQAVSLSGDIYVNLAEIDDLAFRFIENYRFLFLNENNNTK